MNKYNTLTIREKEILKLFLSGLSYKEIAQRLFISLSTVKSHMTRIFEKYGYTGSARRVKLFINAFGNRKELENELKLLSGQNSELRKQNKSLQKENFKLRLLLDKKF